MISAGPVSVPRVRFPTTQQRGVGGGQKKTIDVIKGH